MNNNTKTFTPVNGDTKRLISTNSAVLSGKINEARQNLADVQNEINFLKHVIDNFDFFSLNFNVHFFGGFPYTYPISPGGSDRDPSEIKAQLNDGLRYLEGRRDYYLTRMTFFKATRDAKKNRRKDSDDQTDDANCEGQLTLFND